MIQYIKKPYGGYTVNFYEEELVVRRLGASLRTHPAGHVFLNPKRESATLVAVLEGEISFASGVESHIARRGECIYIPVGLSTRSHHIAEYNKTINFFFDITEGSLGSGITVFERGESVIALLEELGSELSREGALDTNYLRHYFYKLVWLATSQKQIDKKYLKIHSLMLELETRYAENRLLADYARDYLMSESSLRSLFRKYTGKSVIQYRNFVRLRRAEELIRDGMGVGEAAVTVGFSSASFYCRLVKKYKK